MAKNKAELQSDAVHYRDAMSAMRGAHREEQVIEAIKIAMASLDYIDGMMQFERRFEGRNERKSIETIDYILRYAPLVFDHASLDRLAAVLKSQKRIDKNATADIADDLRKANELMWYAYRLWSELERTQYVSQDKLRTNLGWDQERWRGIAESWDEMGLIQRIPERGSYQLSLATRITAITRGKCPKCGVTGKAAIGSFLEPITCPKCKATSHFIILPVTTQASK